MEKYSILTTNTAARLGRSGAMIFTDHDKNEMGLIDAQFNFKITPKTHSFDTENGLAWYKEKAGEFLMKIRSLARLLTNALSDKINPVNLK